jgi:hypothetical protein
MKMAYYKRLLVLSLAVLVLGLATVSSLSQGSTIVDRLEQVTELWSQNHFVIEPGDNLLRLRSVIPPATFESRLSIEPGDNLIRLRSSTRQSTSETRLRIEPGDNL